jgi:hypothetical protein
MAALPGYKLPEHSGIKIMPVYLGIAGFFGVRWYYSALPVTCVLVAR